MSTPINCVGDKHIVGQIDFSLGSAASKLLPGTTVLNGPCYIGANASPGIPRATCMIGPSLFGNPNSLEVIGITNIFGFFNVSAVSVFTGLTTLFGTTIFNGIAIKNAVDIKNALNLANGPSVFNGILTANGTIQTPLIVGEVGNFIDINCDNINASVGNFGQLNAPGKHFNIPHPSKPGHRLVHACLEGPEYGVYFRGQLKDKTFIELPKFWDNLINPESITVHFTPRRIYQELYVKSIDWGKVIHIANNLGGPIDCDYVIYAERKDIDKLVVEYEGDSIYNEN